MVKVYLASLIFVLALCSKCKGAPVESYEELTSAMRSGNQVMIEVDLAACMQNKAMPVGYFTPNALMIVPGAKEKVVASDLHFTDHSGRPAYEYVKYTFNADESVLIEVSVYDPVTFKQLSKPYTISSSLGQGVNVHLAP